MLFFNSLKKPYKKKNKIKINLNKYLLKLFIPNNIIFLLFNNNILVFNHLKIKIENPNSIYFENINKILYLRLLKYNNILFFISKLLNTINISLVNYVFFKMKFKGKFFKFDIDSFLNKIDFYFGHSHPTNFYYKNLYLIQHNKRSFLIFNKNINILLINLKKFVNVRKNDIYTNRGLRRNKDLIFKKIGKTASNY